MREPSSSHVERMFAALIAACDLAPRLAALCAAHPNLTASGFDIGSPEQRPDHEQVRRALYWLCGDDARLQCGESSYTLKHAAEHWLCEQAPHENGYVSNGAMIAALLLAGWPLRQRGINARIVRERRAAPPQLGTTNRKTVARGRARRCLITG